MILVTGGAGYIGSHFVYRAIKRDTTLSVVVLDNLSEGKEQALAGFDRVHLVKGDIGDRQLLGEVLQKYPIDAVVHFAAHAYVGESQQLPFKYFQNNVTNSLSLFETMDKHNVKKIVFSSSCATYGDPQYSPIDELHPQKPVNTYGMTKLMVEQILSRLARTAGWSTVCLRYFNASGAEAEAQIGESHNPETHLLPRVLQAASGSLSEVLIHGGDYDTKDGTCVRDYVHVNDLADGHIDALNLLRSGKEIEEAVNLGTSRGYTVLEVVKKCEEISGRKIKVVSGPRRPGDPPELVANATKARFLLKWQPKYSLDDIISSAWNWELKRRY